MKKNVFLVILFIGIVFFSQAAYLKDVPQTLTQPDGTKVHCYASGDEYFHWLHDENGYPIVKNSENGYFVYAEARMGELVPTDHAVGSVDPSKIGISRDFKVNKEKWETGRKNLIMNTSTNTPLKAKAPNTGVFNNIVVFIRFNDESEFNSSIDSYDSQFNDESNVSMKDYFDSVSYNQLYLDSSFYPQPSSGNVVSYQDTYDRSYFQPYDETTNPNGYSSDTERNTREHALLKRAIESVETQITNSGINVDQDSDGYVDNVVFIVKGSPDGWSDLLWPHRWVLYLEDAYIGSKQVWDFNLQLETSLGVSVLCHEMFHSLGAPDLYRYYDSSIIPIGPWDLMAYNGNPPQHMGAFMKYKYGKWIDSIPQINSSGTYTLNPLSSSTNNVYKIATPNSETEYFIVEYRKKDTTYEQSIPGEGLLVYRINTSADDGNADGPPDEVYVYRPNGTLNNTGSLYSAHFSQSTGRTAINDGTNPNSFLSDGSAGGLNISSIGATNSQISFYVEIDDSIVIGDPISTPSGGTFFDKIVEVSLSTNTLGANIYYTLDGTDPDADSNLYSEPILITRDTTVKAVAEKDGVSSNIITEDYVIQIDSTKLEQNYPNPVILTTTINYKVKNSGNVKLFVYDFKGRIIKKLINEYLEDGFYNITWNCKDKNGNKVSPGIYYYILSADGKKIVKKMVVLK